MDNINIESTLSYIEKKDEKLKSEMDIINFDYDGLSNEGQKLLQILNYSPKIIRPTREKIKNLKSIEIKQFSELKNLDYSKLDINPKQRNKNRKEIKQMIKSLLQSIIEEIIKNINNKKLDENNIENIENNSIKEEKIKLNLIKYHSTEIKFKENYFYELKVFIFNKDDFIIINITTEDTIKAIKEKIINKIIAEKEYEIKYSSDKDYELRILKKEDDKFILGQYPIEDTKYIFENNIKIISFLENNLYKFKSSKV